MGERVEERGGEKENEREGDTECGEREWKRKVQGTIVRGEKHKERGTERLVRGRLNSGRIKGSKEVLTHWSVFKTSVSLLLIIPKVLFA